MSGVRLGWFTGAGERVASCAHRPAGLKAWVASLSKDELMALTQQLASGALTGEPRALADVGSRNREIELAPPPDEPSLFTLTIELRGLQAQDLAAPALPGDLTLDVVHTLFQAAMGWTDSHLHRFQPGSGRGYDQPYFITEFDEEEGDEGTREDGVRLDQVLRGPGDRLTYLYDFGDGWEHRVTLESLASLTPGTVSRCAWAARELPAGGRRRDPRTSRARCLASGRGPSRRRARTFRRRRARARVASPSATTPTRSTPAEATAAMRMWARGEHLPWHGLPEPLADLVQRLRGEGWSVANAWLTALGPRLAVDLDEQDVRRAARPWRQCWTPSGGHEADRRRLPATGRGRADRAGRRGHGLVDRQGQPGGPHPAGCRSFEGTRKKSGCCARPRGRWLRPLAPAPSQTVPASWSPRCSSDCRCGKGFEADAGWLLLLGLAAGESGQTLDTGVAQDVDRPAAGAPPAAPESAPRMRAAVPARRSRCWSQWQGDHRVTDTALVTRLARATLLGISKAP